MEILNDDCLVAILSELDMRSIVCASHVCRWTRAVALSNPCLWTDLHWAESFPCTAHGAGKTPAVRRAAFTEVLSRAGGATDLRLGFTLLVSNRATAADTRLAESTVAEMTYILQVLRERIVELVLNFEWARSPAHVGLPLDLPRLRRLDVCRTDTRLITGTPVLPTLTAFTYPGTGCGFWPGLALADACHTLRELECPTVIQRYGADAQTRSSAWFDAITSLFPQLERLRVWESLDPAHDWQTLVPSPSTDQTPQPNSGPPKPQRRLVSLDVRRLGLAHGWTDNLLALFALHGHVGLHGIQQPTDFARMLPCTSGSSSSSNSPRPTVRRVSVSVRPPAASNVCPFTLGPSALPIFHVAATFSDGRSRAMSTLNRRCAVQCLQDVIQPTLSSSVELDLDGPQAWGMLYDVRNESRTAPPEGAARDASTRRIPQPLDNLISVAVHVRSLNELLPPSPTRGGDTFYVPNLQRMAVVAPVGDTLGVDGGTLAGLVSRFNAVPDVSLVGVCAA